MMDSLSSVWRDRGSEEAKLVIVGSINYELLQRSRSLLPLSCG